MPAFKVLVSDKLSDTGVAILKGTPGLEVDIKTGMDSAELISVIADYDALIIRSATNVTKEVLDAATNLKVVGRAGIGVDNVDTQNASAKGVVVMNTPGGNIVTTAEHAIAMMMSLSRKIPQANASIMSGKWEKSKFVGVELYSKTLGIIGIGRVGSIVARRAHGFEMNVIAFDPFISADAAEKMGVKLVSLEELYAEADFISIHSQLTPETRGMINKDAFAKMKKGMRIINCARGGIINEVDLAIAIKSGQVAGAALDVFDTEPVNKDNPLLGMEEVVLTPHLGASTSEAQENVAIAVAHQVADYLTKDIIRNAINVPSIDPEELQIIRPYLSLGERMGAFVAQITDGAPERIEITYMGKLAELNDKPITQAILKGALEAYVGKTVNLVNAPYLAESRGIVVSATTSSVKRNFASLLSVKITTDTRTMTAEGTVFAGDEPRLVKLEDVIIEAILTGDLLVFTNKDQPGVIGDIGTYMGEQKINMAHFHLGRTEKGKDAISIVNVDTAPSQNQIAEMKKIDAVLDVKLVNFS